jgi:hydroxymethylpyrimidine pyrophosphatase-like HAD family hydrolase
MTRQPALPANIAAVVSDVDGALAQNDKSVSLRTVEAVKALQDAGVKFTIVSSWPPRGLKTVISRLNIVTAVAGFNGCVVASKVKEPPISSLAETTAMEPSRPSSGLS